MARAIPSMLHSKHAIEPLFDILSTDLDGAIKLDSLEDCLSLENTSH